MTEETKKARGEKPTRKRRQYLALMTYQGGPILAKLTTSRRAADQWAQAWAKRAETWNKWRAEVRTLIKAERGNFYREREELRRVWGPTESQAAGSAAPQGSIRIEGPSQGGPMTEREELQDLFQGNPEALAFSDQLDEIDRMAELMNQGEKTNEKN